jgi:hypothetical protein
MSEITPDSSENAQPITRRAEALSISAYVNRRREPTVCMLRGTRAVKARPSHMGDVVTVGSARHPISRF